MSTYLDTLAGQLRTLATKHDTDSTEHALLVAAANALTMVNHQVHVTVFNHGEVTRVRDLVDHIKSSDQSDGDLNSLTLKVRLALNQMLDTRYRGVLLSTEYDQRRQ